MKDPLGFKHSYDIIKDGVPLWWTILFVIIMAPFVIGAITASIEIIINGTPT